MGKVTIKDIAKVANVSYATVSRALSGSPEIGEATRERVLKLCDEMNYIPNSVARSMVKRRTNIMGVITASINNPFMSELIEAIVERQLWTPTDCKTPEQTLYGSIFREIATKEHPRIVRSDVKGKFRIAE